MLHLCGYSSMASALVVDAARLKRAWDGPRSPAFRASHSLLALVSVGGTYEDEIPVSPLTFTTTPGKSRGNSQRRQLPEAREESPPAVQESDRDTAAPSTVAVALEASYRRDGAAEVPKAILSTASAAATLQLHGKHEAAGREFEHCVGLCRGSSAGPSSCAVGMVSLMLAAATTVSPTGEVGPAAWAVRRAEELRSETGPDSLAEGEAAAVAAWLLLLEGHASEALTHIDKAVRVKCAWLGPTHHEVAACEVLREIAVAAAGNDDPGPQHSQLPAESLAEGGPVPERTASGQPSPPDKPQSPRLVTVQISDTESLVDGEPRVSVQIRIQDLASSTAESDAATIGLQPLAGERTEAEAEGADASAGSGGQHVTVRIVDDSVDGEPRVTVQLQVSETEEEEGSREPAQDSSPAATSGSVQVPEETPAPATGQNEEQRLVAVEIGDTETLVEGEPRVSVLLTVLQ